MNEKADKGVLKKERGQAALEFLTTYGWALLVILVMIGALSFFGILDPGKLTPERCTVTQGFSCLDYRLSMWVNGAGVDDPEVAILLRNDLGTTVTIQPGRNLRCDGCKANFQDCGTNAWCQGLYSMDGSIDSSDLESFTVAAGESFQWRANQLSGAQILFQNTGVKEKVQFTFSYIEAGGKYPHLVEGEIYATVQEQS